MSVNMRAWYTMPGDAEVKPEDFDYSFYAHYYPAPYTAYAGQRQGNAEAEKSDGRPVLRILGDSTIATSGICGQIESRLKAAGANVAVQNSGVISANANMMLSNLVHSVLDARPEATIAVSGPIDALIPLQFDPRPGYPHFHALQEVIFEHFFNPARSSFWIDRPPLSPEELRRAYFAKLALRRVEHHHLTSAWEQTVVDSYRSAVRKSLMIAAAADLKLAYVLAPLLAFKKSPTAAEAATLPPQRTLDYLDRIYAGMSKALLEEGERFADNPNIVVRDMHALFANETGEAFFDLVHWTPTGQAKMADSLVDLIEPWRESLSLPVR